MDRGEKHKSRVRYPQDRIEEDEIVLDVRGSFPKKVIIQQGERTIKEYRLTLTRNGGLILN